MKTFTFTRLSGVAFTCLLVVCLDSCTKIQEPIDPLKSNGARGGVSTEIQGGPPTTSSYPDGPVYEDGQEVQEGIVLKTIGQTPSNQINENEDFRLYPTAIACQAYEYLFLRANATGFSELGAYVTGRGIIIGPNSYGSSGNYAFRTWGTSPYSRAPFIYTTGGLKITITGMIHTHPGGTASPSPDDQVLAGKFDIPQYLIANLYLYLFRADGTTTNVAHYSDRDCN